MGGAGVVALGSVAAVMLTGEETVDVLQPVMLASALGPEVFAAPKKPAAEQLPIAQPPQPIEPPPKAPRAEPEPEPEPPQPPPLVPPPRGSDRQAWLAYAQAVAQRRTEQAAAKRASGSAISDEFGRDVGKASYPNEEETDLALRLNAIVDPRGREAFAIIEDDGTGVVASYREGTVLPPGVLPGVWVVDVEPGVVHLLDLESNSFEYLTFAKPPKLSPAARRAKRRRERARKRAAKRRKAKKRK